VESLCAALALDWVVQWIPESSEQESKALFPPNCCAPALFYIFDEESGWNSETCILKLAVGNLQLKLAVG